jgi:large subunit ribosomal protein L13
LKIETFKQLQARIPSRIIEEAVWGMLPKGVLGRNYYRRLFVYSDNKINYKTENGERISIPMDEQKITGLL